MNKVSVAGVSRLPSGVMKVRFGNDITRVKVMAKNGDTDIDLRSLPNEMEKGEAIKYLLTTDLVEDGEIAGVLQEADHKYNGSKAKQSGEPRKPRAPRVKQAKAIDPSEKMADLKARAAAVAEAK